MKSFIKEGIITASASDYPVTADYNPLRAIQLGVTRTDIDKENPGPKDVLNPEERVSIQDIVDSFTINSAHALFVEDTTGSLEVGKKADFIVLDKNIFQVPSAEIHTADVLWTMLEGKEVYRNPACK